MQNHHHSGISKKFWNVEDADYEKPGPRVSLNRLLINYLMC
jgi:hypothetical protein